MTARNAPDIVVGPRIGYDAVSGSSSADNFADGSGDIAVNIDEFARQFERQTWAGRN